MSSQPHSAKDLDLIYQRRFAGMEEYRQGVWRILCSEIFSRWVLPGSTVLDLGAGYCEFINQIAAQRKYAMDLNPATKGRASADVEVLLQDCSSPWEIPDETLDTVFTSNFFEHLPDKTALERTVQCSFRSLKSGGRLVAMGPNIRYTGTAYWDFYDHYIPLTDLSLIELFEKCGFEVEYAQARFLPYTMAVGRRYPFRVLKIYLKLAPLWKVFGKQFLIVFRKP